MKKKGSRVDVSERLFFDGRNQHGCFGLRSNNSPGMISQRYCNPREVEIGETGIPVRSVGVS